MDIDAIIQKHENEIKIVQQYREHPITKAILEDNLEQQNAALIAILEHPVTSIESFLAREQLLGHLRGLRRMDAVIQQKIDDIKEALAKETE